MSTVTRTKLDVCTTKDCPWRDDEDMHIPWCRGIEGVQHTGIATHQHWPKRSQGGKEIVAILCSYCHDRIDNFDWGNKVLDGVYTAWDLHGNILIRRALNGATSEESEGSGSPTDPERENLRSPLVVAPQGADAGADSGAILPHGHMSSTDPAVTPAQRSLSQWCERGMGLLMSVARIRGINTELAFEVGDWLNESHGHEAAQYWVPFERYFSRAQLSNFASVAQRVPKSVRLVARQTDNLSFDHFRAVARLEPPEQRETLEKAAREGTPARALWERQARATRETCVCPECGKEHGRAAAVDDKRTDNG